MSKLKFALIPLFVFATIAIAQDPMAPGLYNSAAEIAEGLENPTRPGMAVSRLQVSDHYRINMIKRTQPAGAIIHNPGTELHYIIDGAGTLTTGGIIVRPEGGGPGNIQGGLDRRVTVGDSVLIPEGTPHQYTDVEGSVTYLEVRFNVPVE